MKSAWRLALICLAIYVAAFAVRTYATNTRVSAGHGDVAGYFHVAKNLATGRGFVQDFVAEYLEDPRAIPAPSNTWWLPLPSMIAALGMKIAGETSYVAAKYAMISVSSLIPVLCLFAGWFLLRCKTAGLATAILAIGFHLYLDQPNATLSHGPYALFAASGLLIVMAWREHPRALPWFGLCFGATYLCRGDSQALVVGLVVTLAFEAYRRWRARREDPGVPTGLLPWRALIVSALTFLAIASPWWARNLSVLGTPMPSGMSKITWAKNYEDWFVSDTSHLTFERYREWGLDKILEQKREGVLDAIEYTPFVMYRSVTRETGAKPGDIDYRLYLLGKWVLTPLLFLGLLALALSRPREFALLLLHIALLAAIYGIVFPAIGRESYRSSLFSVFPVLLTAVIGGWSLIVSPLRKVSPLAHAGVLLLGAVALSAANVVAAKPQLENKYATSEGSLVLYRAFGAWAREHGLENETFLVRYPWQFTVETGMKSAILPNDGVKGMLERARIYQARYFLDEFPGGHSILEWRPALNALIAKGDVTLAFPDDPPNHFRIYRIGDALLRGS